MKRIITILLVLNIQLVYSQTKIEYNTIDTIIPLIDLDTQRLVYYLTDEATFCVQKDDIVLLHQNSIIAFESYLNDQEEKKRWQKKRLHQLILMKDYLLEQDKIVISDPEINIDQYNLKNPSIREFTALHIEELICPLLDDGKVQITYKGEYLDSYLKADVTEYDAYSSTRSIQYLLVKDSIKLLQCGDVIHADFEID